MKRPEQQKRTAPSTPKCRYKGFLKEFSRSLTVYEGNLAGEAMIGPFNAAAAVPGNVSTQHLPSVLPTANETSAEAGLRRWLSFGAVLRRVASSLSLEVERASQDVATETETVTRLFQNLATKAAAQSARVAELAAMASTVTADGVDMALADLASMFEGSLDDIVSKILQLSRHSMSTVYALQEVSKSMREVELCIAAVDQVNRKTGVLAINARIEAARAGLAGLAFSVVSDEVHTLSGSTKQLSDTMRTHVGAVARGLHDSNEALRTVATLDMSENIMAKEKLNRLVVALIDRSTQLGAIAQQAARDAEDIAREVGQAITCLQFQDRVAQRLAQVTDTMSIVGDAVSDLLAETELPFGEPSAEESDREAAWLRALSDRYRLSEMRAAFVTQVLGGESPIVSTATDVDAGGSVELF